HGARDRPGTGAGRWSTNVGANVFGDVLLRDDLVIVATTEIYSRADRGYLIALDQRTGAERWRIKTRGNVRSTPLAHGDDLVVGTESGTLEVWRVRR
ncbi:MAG: PQQ-binding-like beta-propeller repeat protein, partial [Gemmatimonadales bacterium]